VTALVAPGTAIAVIAPSHAYDPHKLEAGIGIARARGHDLRLFEGTLHPHRYFAAPLGVRRAHLVEALTEEQYGAVWLVRGGSGMLQVLADLPWERLRPKPVIGFSDAVALHLALAGHDLGPSIHGPMLHTLPSTDQDSIEHLFRLLAGEPVEPLRGETWVPGEARGPLVGGNLCVLAATCGTPWQLDGEGAILVLEEIGEYPYRIDRMLQQLASAGVFDGIAGVAVGEFLNTEPQGGADWTVRDILMDHFGPRGVPVLGGLPIGHGARNHAFVWGAPARLGHGALAL
jgi:muramoyltetrapeptide carboxypeptidase